MAEDTIFGGEDMWGFFNNPRVWPVIHVVSPFNVYLVTQSVWWTIFLFMIFESIELVIFLLCDMEHCAWGGGTSMEFVGDSLIGDILQGFVGLAIAYTLRATLRVPNYSVDSRESFVAGRWQLWWKRMLWLVLFSISVIPANWRQDETQAWGMFFVIGGQLLLLAIFGGFWNRTRDEQLRSWMRNKKFDSAAYTRFYLVWALAVIWLNSAGFYKPLGLSSYIFIAIHGAALVIGLMVTAVLRGDGKVVADLLTLGIYSCVRKKPSYAALPPRTEDASPINSLEDALLLHEQ